jgi:hypothetical protein
MSYLSSAFQTRIQTAFKLLVTLVVRVQLRRLSLLGDHAVTLIHYEGRLSDTLLSVYADSCLVSVFVVADADELFIYATPLTRCLILFAGWVTGWSSIQLVIGCNKSGTNPLLA